MGDADQITLYIILRQSLQLDSYQSSYCVANAIQYLLLKYFTTQVLAVKTHLNYLVNDAHLATTTKWLSTQSKKNIITVNDQIWDQIKQELREGKDFFCLKEFDPKTETTLVLWPTPYSAIPTYLK